jgi:Domain of unknown function (DUF4168)
MSSTKTALRTGAKLGCWMLAFCLVLLVWVLPVNAAEPPTAAVAEPTLGRSVDADDISAEKINQFVRAYLKVLALIEGREAELQGAEMELESQQIQREIEAQAIALIQAEKLTLQEYLQLLSFTNIDPEFGERVATQLQEAVQ